MVRVLTRPLATTDEEHLADLLDPSCPVERLNLRALSRLLKDPTYQDLIDAERFARDLRLEQQFQAAMSRAVATLNELLDSEDPIERRRAASALTRLSAQLFRRTRASTLRHRAGAAPTNTSNSASPASPPANGASTPSARSTRAAPASTRAAASGTASTSTTKPTRTDVPPPPWYNPIPPSAPFTEEGAASGLDLDDHGPDITPEQLVRIQILAMRKADTTETAYIRLARSLSNAISMGYQRPAFYTYLEQSAAWTHRHHPFTISDPIFSDDISCPLERLSGKQTPKDLPYPSPVRAATLRVTFTPPDAPPATCTFHLHLWTWRETLPLRWHTTAILPDPLPTAPPTPPAPPTTPPTAPPNPSPPNSPTPTTPTPSTQPNTS